MKVFLVFHIIILDRKKYTNYEVTPESLQMCIQGRLETVTNDATVTQTTEHDVSIVSKGARPNCKLWLFENQKLPDITNTPLISMPESSSVSLQWE